MGFSALGFTPRAAQKSPGRASLYLDFRDQIYVLGGWLYGSLPALGLTNSRSTPRTVVRNGTILDVLAGENAIGDNGLSVRGQMTNNFLYSEAIDNAAWSKFEASVTPNATTAPNGSPTADLVLWSNSTAVKLIDQSVTSAARWAEFYVKPYGGETTCSLWVAGVTKYAVFDLTGSGSITTQTTDDAEIEALADGWYRIAVYDETATALVRLYGRTGTTFTSDGTTGLYVWGAGWVDELGPYIKTEGSAVTRGADSPSIPIGEWLDPTQPFTVLAEYDIPAGAGTNLVLASLDSDANNLIELRATGSDAADCRFEVLDGGVQQHSQHPLGGTGSHKVGLRVEADNVRSAVDGALDALDNNASIPTVTHLRLGYSPYFSSYLGDGLKQLLIIPEALSDAELQAWTGA